MKPKLLNVLVFCPLAPSGETLGYVAHMPNWEGYHPQEAAVCDDDHRQGSTQKTTIDSLNTRSLF